MKQAVYLILLLLALESVAQTPLNVNIGSIDHNQTGREVASLLQTFPTDDKAVLVVNDFGCRLDRFMTFDGQEVNTVFTANLDDFEYRIVAQYAEFVLINDRNSATSVSVLERNVRTGQTRTLFTSQSGLGFSESFTDGYVYLDGNRNLYATDGTISGTILISDNIRSVDAAKYGDRVVLATDLGYFITDGTTAGTIQLTTSPSPGITDDLIWNGDLYLLLGNTFFATDGTVAGSRFLHQAADNQFSFNLSATPSGLVFVSRTTAEGREVWTSDGTRAGTRILTALIPGPDDGVSSSFAVKYTDDILLVRGGPTADHNFLYRATATGLQQLLDLTGASSSRWGLNLFGQTEDQNLYLTTTHLTDQDVLWRISAANQATSIDTVDRNAINPNEAFVRENGLLFLGGPQPDRLYYTNTSRSDISEIDSTGTELPPYFLNEQHFNYTKPPSSGYLYQELYTIDFTTGQRIDLQLRSMRDNDVAPFFEFDNKLHAVVLDSQLAEVIVNLNGSTPALVTDLLPYTRSSSFDFMEAAGEYVYFIIDSELFIAYPGSDTLRSLGVQLSDRTANQIVGQNLIFTIDNETILITSPSGAEYVNLPVNFRSGLGDYALLNNNLYFIANQSNNQRTRFYLGKIDLANSSIVETVFSVEEDVALNEWNGAGSKIVVAENQLFFAFPSLSAGWELGVSDGTTSGTRLYQDLIPGTMSSSPQDLIGEGNKLAIRTFRRVGSNNLFVYYLPQGRRFESELVAFNNRLIQLSSTNTHTYLGLSIATRGDNDLLVIDDASFSSRRTPIHLNSDLFQLPDRRIGYWSDRTTLTTTSGDITTDSVYQNLEGSQEQSFYFADQFFYTAFRQNSSFLESINLETREQFLVSDITINTFVDYAQTSNRVYFPASSKIVAAEPHYLESSILRLFSGIVFNDENGNGVQNGTEALIEGAKIVAQRDGSLFSSSLTDSNGSFSFQLPSTGNFTIAPALSSCYSVSTSPTAYNLTPSTLATSALRFGLNTISDSLGLRPTITVSNSKCNEEGPTWINLRNSGCVALTSSYTLTLPQGSTFISASTPPSQTSGGELSWDNLSLNSGGQWQNRLLVRMPDETNAGDTLTWNASSIGLASTAETVTASTSQTSVLLCAIDPNDKLVSPARPEPSNSNYTQVDEVITYTIRFQNTGNASANLVRLEDQLSSNLEWQSFTPLDASHTYSYTLDDGGLLEVRFDNIMLPDSNASLSMSQGYFSYSILPKTSSIGDVVLNEANIYFDSNSPILTNEVSSSIVEFLDEDEDGFFFWDDCDDQNDMAYPGAPEIPDNGVDEDCDGDDVTPTDDQRTIKGFQVYPNPTSGVLSISLSEPKDYILRFISTAGQLVQEQVITNSTTTLALDLPPGMYQLMLIDEVTGEQGTRAVVIE